MRKLLNVALGASMLALASPVEISRAASADCLDRAPIDLATGILQPPKGCSFEGRVVHVGDTPMVVPERGIGVVSVAGGRTVTLSHRTDGAIEAEGGESGRTGKADRGESDGLQGGGNSTGTGCATSTAYTLKSFKQYGTYTWYYNATGEPALGAGSPITFIHAGASSITNGYNDCGVTSMPATAFHSHGGSTTSLPNANSSSGCTARDAKSTVGWRALGGALGVACIWIDEKFSPHKAIEADIAFGSDASWYSGSCVLVEFYDLQSTSVHEFGHVFGLGHVPESGTGTSSTAALTMSERQSRCDTQERTLGIGDLNGLFARYGRV